MIKYRIKEIKFQENKSIFIPQYQDDWFKSVDGNGELMWYDIEGTSPQDYIVPDEKNTYDKAFEFIKKDKLKKLKQIDIVYHDIL